MAADLTLSSSGPSRTYTPDVRKADGTRSNFTDRPLVELAPESNHATAAGIAALQSSLLSAIGLLATDQDVMAGNSKLEAIRLLLATPATPVGASTSAKQDVVATVLGNILTALGPVATDTSVQAVTTKLEAVRALLVSPSLASGASTDTSVQAVTTKLEAIRLLQASPALPTGAATEATLQAIKAAILAQVDLANLIVTDGTGYYVRRETVSESTGVVTVNFTTLSGAAASPNVSALAPVTASGSGSAANTRVVETALFDVVTASAGASVGDVVARVLVYDTAANTVVASYWHNLTTGAALASAPPANTVVSQPHSLAVGAAKDASLQSIIAALGPLALDSSVQAGTAKSEAIRALLAGTLAISAASLPLPAGAATAGKQDVAAAVLNQLDVDLNAGLGSDGTSPPSLPGGATGVRGWLRQLASLLPASLGAKLSAASLSVAPATDALFSVAGSAAAGSAPTNPPLSVSGVDSGGLKRHLLTDVAGASVVVQKPFQPIPGATKSVTTGPVATAAGSLPLAAPSAIPVGAATSYRVRNAATSASPITWILTTDPAKTPVIPTPYVADGTGGAAGDKTIDPGSVEIISLSAAQQAALAAGTLYLSAVTPSGGSGTLSITPGNGA